MLRKAKYIAFMVLGAVVVSGCSSPQEFGPWDGYIYVANDVKKEFTLMSQGRYPYLEQCMRNMQSRTSGNGYPYYCGFKCKTNSEGELDCEKIMGYPELN